MSDRNNGTQENRSVLLDFHCALRHHRATLVRERRASHTCRQADLSIDNLFIAQREKDQARTQYVQALRGFWEAYYMLRRLTLHDFEKDEIIR